MTWLYAAFVALLLKVILDEVLEWCPWVAQRLIRRAALRLPSESSQRYCEEWLAELDALPGKGVSKLAFAARVFWSTPRVRAALTGSPTPTTRLALRVLDASLSGLGLLVFAPWFALIALAIRMSGPGPVVIRVRRIDARGEVFASRLAFRTFRTADESGTNGETRIGEFLRRTALIYFPAYVDILRGRMSLVGPPTKLDGVKPGLADWRLAFQRWDEIDWSADPHIAPPWASEWKARHAVRAMIRSVSYVLLPLRDR